MRNVIHTDGNYQIELTSKGKFLVRNQAGNELGQFDANDAALQRIADDRQRWTNKLAEGAAYNAIRDNFFALNGDMEANQLAWQAWRSGLYESIQRLARHLAAHDRSLARKDASDHHFERLERDKETLRVANQVYGKAVALDTKLKDAGFAADRDVYVALWNQAKHLMDTSSVAI